MRGKNRNVCRDVLAGLLLAALLVFGFSVQGQAAASAGAVSGSITLILTQTDRSGNKTVYPDIGLKLYKAGSLRGDGTMSYVMDSGFASSGVDFNSLDTAEDWTSAASALAALADKSGVIALTGTADAQGKVVFGGLAEGMYLAMQNGNENEIEISPVLLSIPMQEEGRLNTQVTVYPKFRSKKLKTDTGVTGQNYHTSSAAGSGGSTPVNNIMGTSVTYSVKTGDDTSVAAWVAIVVLAAAVVVIAGVVRKKRK